MLVVAIGWRGSLMLVGGLVVVVMFHCAAAGKPLHHEFASRAAAVDGEITDVVGNMMIVKAFGGLLQQGVGTLVAKAGMNGLEAVNIQQRKQNAAEALAQHAAGVVVLTGRGLRRDRPGVQPALASSG